MIKNTSANQKPFKEVVEYVVCYGKVHLTELNLTLSNTKIEK